MFKLWSLITVLGLAAFPGFPAEQNPSLLKGRLLLPGIVSTGLFERDFTLSSDGKEIYFTVMGPGFSVIMTTSFTRGKWTSPVPAFFQDIGNILMQSLFFLMTAGVSIFFPPAPFRENPLPRVGVMKIYGWSKKKKA